MKLRKANHNDLYQNINLLTYFSFVFLVKISALKSLSISNTKTFQSTNFSSKTLRKNRSIDLCFGIDIAYNIYVDETVSPYMSFPKVNREEFAGIFAKFVDDLLVYEDNDNIAAIIGITQLPYRSSHVCYIHKLAVNPKLQHRGIGAKLFSDVIANLKEQGISRLELKVESDNHNAIKFYKKIGFQIEGTLKNYFNRDGEFVDEHFMGMMI